MARIERSLIDIYGTLLATAVGVIQHCGFGASQLGAGLHQLGWISENSFSLQVVMCRGNEFSDIFRDFGVRER